MGSALRILTFGSALSLTVAAFGQSSSKVATGHPWFDVYELRPGTFLIHEPGHPERVASYLLLGEERALLFDSGLGIGDIWALVAELTDLPVAVLASHTHPDHIGGHGRFERVYGTDTTATRRAARGLDGAAARRVLRESSLTRRPPAGFDPEAYRLEPFAVSDLVRDGQVIDLGARRLEILITPGHAEDALCVLDRKGRLLLTGDTFYLGRVLVADWTAFSHTSRRLADLAGTVDRLLPAHSSTLLPARWLQSLGSAVEAVEAGAAEGGPFEAPWAGEGRWEYRFEGFSILTREVNSGLGSRAEQAPE